MPKKKLSESRVTLYRLVDLRSLKSAMRSTYRKQFKVTKTTVGGREALIAVGKTAKKRVGWAETFSGLTGVSVTEKTSMPGGIIIIKDEAVPSITANDGSSDGLPSAGTSARKKFDAWAITFGSGFHTLDQDRVDTGFGQRIAFRSVDPSKLNSLTKVTLDDRSKVERSSIPMGASIRSFGVEELGELVTRLVAKGAIKGVGAKDKEVMIRGADALSLPLSKNPDALLNELARIKETLSTAPVSDDLALIEKLTIVKNRKLLKSLDAALLRAIRKPNPKRLGLSWPHEKTDENGVAQAHKMVGLGVRKVFDGLPTLEGLLAPVKKLPKSEQADKLDSWGVLLFEDPQGEKVASGKLSIRKWLSYEKTIGDYKYFLHGGRWYSMEQKYAATVLKRTKEIFARDAKLPPFSGWTLNFEDELEYNKYIASQVGGLLLDRKLISADLRKGRFEACDILLKDGTFIHVKHTNSSAPASHLLAQALVSAEILAYDSTARKNLKKLIVKQKEDPKKFQLVPKKVVIVMAKESKALDPQSLFTFTQVNLRRQERALASSGVDVFVIPVVKDPKQ